MRCFCAQKQDNKGKIYLAISSFYIKISNNYQAMLIFCTYWFACLPKSTCISYNIYIFQCVNGVLVDGRWYLQNCVFYSSFSSNTILGVWYSASLLGLCYIITSGLLSGLVISLIKNTGIFYVVFVFNIFIWVVYIYNIGVCDF